MPRGRGDTISTADFKAPPRVIEDREGWEQLRRAKLGPCRVCGNTWLPTLHHLVGVGRGKEGDDVPANLIPLCRAHHQAFHDGDLVVIQIIGETLTLSEIGYIVGKKGEDFLRRRYHVPAEWIEEIA